MWAREGVLPGEPPSASRERSVRDVGGRARCAESSAPSAPNVESSAPGESTSASYSGDADRDVDELASGEGADVKGSGGG
jgi:hypothetical protein